VDGVRILLRAPIVFATSDGETQHTPLVVAEVAGHETRLILDTGCDVQLLTRELVDSIGLTVDDGEPGTDHAGEETASWSAAGVPIRIAGVGIGPYDAVVIPGPPPFEGWGIGGALSPQNLVEDAVAVIDLAGDELVVLEGTEADVAAWVAERAPALETLALERSEADEIVVVPAAIAPFPEIPTLIDTGGKRTEFARTVVPGLAAGAEERIGGGISGADVLGSLAGPQTLVVGGAEVPVPNLAVRDSMEPPHGLVGMDVLRGTVLACAHDRTRPVLWQIPRS
jgi:hypothetical protein